MPGDAVLHIPTPGDHYSSSSGSAVMTVIYEYARIHDAQGGSTGLIVGSGTRHDYPVGDCIETTFSPLPGRNQKIADVLLGRLGLPRRYISRIYEPAFQAMPAGFTGAAVVHNAPAAISGLKAAAPGARAVLYCHNTLFGTYGDAETRRALRSADTVICVSQFLADELKRRLGTDDPRVHGITNGVDTERFRPAEKHTEPETPVLLYVGRVSPEKGPHLLVEAALILAKSKRRFKVRIVGSSNFNPADPLTEYEQELRRMAERISGIVEFVPFVDRSRVVEEYHKASVFCAPSNCDEGCSLTVPEAMACGLPTVASRRGGIPEVGGDGIQYFNPPDASELAERLAPLIENPDDRDRWSALARAQALTLTWETQYRKLREALFPGSAGVSGWT